jgi:DNA-directed RNA polymerase subunit delta
MKRKKGDDEEFDVFGEEDVEAIGDDELEDDEEFDEDDLDDDEFSDDDELDDDFVEDDDLQLNEDDLEEYGNDSER